MKKEGTIGAAAFLAIATVVGFSLQSGPKQGVSGRDGQIAHVKRAMPASKTRERPGLVPGCRNIEEQLQEFLETKRPIAPEECYELGSSRGKAIPSDLAANPSQLKFVIASLPDPLHTHQSLLFDQFAVAIQEAAQDEKYEFDSSWLPWEDEADTYALLSDQEAANSQKASREKQPGILLFSRALQSKGSEKLVVFIIGEEATHGIHKDQFRNALAWIDVLERERTGPRKRLGARLGILGPTFSGSLPSLTQVLAEPATAKILSFSNGNPLAIYSGSVSDNHSATDFQDKNDSKVSFHSFVRSDDEILRRFCNYMKQGQSGFEPQRLAILSEDETAYGTLFVDQPETSTCSQEALKLFYPRDISALRGAYQTKSIFDAMPGSQPTDSQRRSLPTDLADPAGKVHDSIRSYGGNQTPLVQEAVLLQIVAALRDLRARYILLRGSNSLDQLFLANFLRRMYPSGRIVILSSDLLFTRERGATGLNGSMIITNYPLFPLTRDWTEHEVLPAADRVFSSDTSEGTYIAFRVLKNAGSLNDDHNDQDGCHLARDQKEIFVPHVICKDSPIPDYLPPYWMVPDDCSKDQARLTGCNYSGPATWLTVIGVNRFWPIASLAGSAETPEIHPYNSAVTLPPLGTPNSQHDSTEPGRTLELPPGVKVFWLILIMFSIFHAWCCWAGSYTAKPNFRAHFASTGDWQHALLVFSGSCIVAFLAIVSGWGCGAFSPSAYRFAHPWPVFYCVLFVCFMAWISIIARSVMIWRISELQKREIRDFFVKHGFGTILASIFFLAVILGFFWLHVMWIENLLDESDRALTYWRAMHLSSGVSPIVPFISILAGLYLCFWLALHGLALFGPDRPCLPSKQNLKVKFKINEKEEEGDFLRMFSQEDAAAKIEEAAMPFTARAAVITASFFALLLFVSWALERGVPLRGLGAHSLGRTLTIWLVVCIGLQLAGAWRLYELWEELRRLLAFLDRLPLRRTLAALHGFSWGSVWKMSGNVLEVRYKVISRQLESMNHSISALEGIEKNSQDNDEVQAAKDCLKDLGTMRAEGLKFADWYCTAYTNPRAGDLTTFGTFQRCSAQASGTLLTHLLIPAWRKETKSLILAPVEDKHVAEKEGTAPSARPQAEPEHIRNAEEFVCLTYLGFIQNILGRLRTQAMSIMALFLALTLALSMYPFDPRQVLSGVLILLFLILGIVIVKVYAEMHRDGTLSHVTNTKPGELGTEFWFKVLAFGFAPLLGLLTRIFPDISDLIFSWVQPGISSLK
jgi:hypothetical protein